MTATTSTLIRKNGRYRQIAERRAQRQWSVSDVLNRRAAARRRQAMISIVALVGGVAMGAVVAGAAGLI
ncbi:MAG: hypothetical protein PVI23_12025 [Maricaulaceae bacterium]|jgi:hypothetical protein